MTGARARFGVPCSARCWRLESAPEHGALWPFLRLKFSMKKINMTNFPFYDGKPRYACDTAASARSYQLLAFEKAKPFPTAAVLLRATGGR